MPDPLSQSQQETQRAQGLCDVVMVEIGAAKESSGDVMMIGQPAEQGHNWKQYDRGTLEATLDVHSTRLQDFPKRKCQRRDNSGFLAQHGQTESKLGGPNSVFDIK